MTKEVTSDCDSFTKDGYRKAISWHPWQFVTFFYSVYGSPGTRGVYSRPHRDHQVAMLTPKDANWYLMVFLDQPINYDGMPL